MSKGLNERVELKTERLLLRPLGLGDVDDVLAYASDHEVGRYLPVPRPYTHNDAEEYVARRILDEWSTEPTFAIVWKQQVVGTISLHVNVQHETAEMGYALARQAWGRGIVPEAARAVIDWGFERYALHKVSARSDVRNRQSWRVMEKVGMTREGVLRSHHKARDEREDVVCYGILREEWERTPESAV